MSSDTDTFWAGSFGDAYHERNRVDIETRLPFWQSVVDFCDHHSVLEVGCGPGWNLLAQAKIRPNMRVCGVDLNTTAVEEARQQGIEASCLGALGIVGLFGMGSMDLVFTAGMLIHIPPEDIEAVMRSIVMTSAKYVLAVEYAADQEEMIDYRGHGDRLWKRPFGKMYQDMGLNLLVEVPNATGFDNCTAWLLEKP